MHIRPLANVPHSQAYASYEGIVEADWFKPLPLFINIRLLATERPIDLLWSGSLQKPQVRPWAEAVGGARQVFDDAYDLALSAGPGFAARSAAFRASARTTSDATAPKCASARSRHVEGRRAALVRGRGPFSGRVRCPGSARFRSIAAVPGGSRHRRRRAVCVAGLIGAAYMVGLLVTSSLLLWRVEHLSGLERPSRQRCLSARCCSPRNRQEWCSCCSTGFSSGSPAECCR